MKEGLDRHDAIHAIGSAFLRIFYDVATEKEHPDRDKAMPGGYVGGPKICKTASMGEGPDNLVLRYLRSIDTRLGGMARDISEIKIAQSGIVQLLASHDARLLRLEDRLDRIEKRLSA